ncbi:hypothetical protein Taro_032984, partial [Colocasia esculenta]|nr:hypothetical protein [Colocasia esculenta]
MGSGEATTPSKVTPKAPSSAQEQAAATTSSPTATAAPAAAVIYPDWTGFQAYSPVPPHGFFPSVVSSPQTHPYVWGAQNIVTPYGTPAAPFVMYPHGGMYVHPSIPPGAVTDVDGKSSEGKEGSNLKQSNGSLGSLNMITGKNGNEMGKTSGVSANEAFSQRYHNRRELVGKIHSKVLSDYICFGCLSISKNAIYVSVSAGASQNGSAACSSQNGVANTPPQGTMTQPMPALPMAPAAAPGGFSGPATNLNIGMDYWGGPALSQIAPVCGKVHNPPIGGVLVPPGQNISSEIWLQ